MSRRSLAVIVALLLSACSASAPVATDSRSVSSTPASESPVATPLVVDLSPSCLMARAATDLTDDSRGSLEPETYSYCAVGGTLLNIRFAVPAGWEWHGSYMTKGAIGSAHEARISFFAGDLQVYADPCRWSSSEPSAAPTGRTVDDLIAALAAQPMRDAGTPMERYAYVEGADRTLPPTAEGPGVNDWVNGSEGAAIELSVPADLDLAGCDEGEFRSWGPEGNVRVHQGAGQRDLVWALATCPACEGEYLVIDASSMPKTSPDVLTEIDAILDSMNAGHWG